MTHGGGFGAPDVRTCVILLVTLAVPAGGTLAAQQDSLAQRSQSAEDTTRASVVLTAAPPADSASLPQLTPALDRRSLPNRWRRLDPNGLLVSYSLLNPYGQNPLKGDFAVLGQNTFAVLTLIGNPAANVSSQENVDPQFNNRLVGAFELFNGLTVFKPKTWSVRGAVQGLFNRGNADLEELELLELFGEFKLTDIGSQSYDFASVRGGIQAFASDFDGLIYNDINLGGQLFGEAAANRYRWTAAAFSPRVKSPGNGVTFDAVNQTVIVANLVAEDFIRPGFNGLFSVHANLDRSVDNNNLDAYYIGFTSDGNLGRLEFTPTVYFAFGKEDANPIAMQETTIRAFLAGFQLAYPQNWRKYRLAVFMASGDSDPLDDQATGFDAVLDNIKLFGGPNSFVIGGAQLLTRPNSFLPANRAAVQGSGARANFVNPGMQVFNCGIDHVLSPKVFMQFDYNYFRFFDTAVLEPSIGSGVSAGLGHEVSGAVRYRVFLDENLAFQIGGGAFFPQGAGETLLGSSDPLFTGNIALVAVY